MKSVADDAKDLESYYPGNRPDVGKPPVNKKAFAG